MRAKEPSWSKISVTIGAASTSATSALSSGLGTESARNPFREVTASADIALAQWLVERTTARHPSGAGVAVSALLPDAYAAYVRLFHPAEDMLRHSRSWRSVAEHTGRVFHPEAVFERLAAPCGLGEPWQGKPPDVGQIPEAAAERMAQVLTRFTAAATRCWFGVWEGYVVRKTGTEASHHLRGVLHLPIGLSYALYVGPLDSLAHFKLFGDVSWVPNLWWPEDQAWVVHCGPDFDSTFVACERDCARQLATTPGVEVLPTRWDNATEADWINE